jgi:hypothetical protein
MAANTFWRGSGDQPGLVQNAPEALLPKDHAGSLLASRYAEDNTNPPIIQKTGVRWRKKRLCLAAEFEYTGFLELRTGVDEPGLYILKEVSWDQL